MLLKGKAGLTCQGISWMDISGNLTIDGLGALYMRVLMRGR